MNGTGSSPVDPTKPLHGKIVRDLAGMLYAVYEAPGVPSHCYMGINVKKAAGGYVAKSGAVRHLIRKAGTAIVREA